MKKIPTLYVRDLENPSRVTRTLGVELHPGARATAKWDGEPYRYDRGLWYARRQIVSPIQTPKFPPGFVLAEHDPVKGAWRGWVPVDNSNQFKWLRAAIDFAFPIDTEPPTFGTYEAVGPHFQGNHHGFAEDTLKPHGGREIDTGALAWWADYDFMDGFLRHLPFEGVVWWHMGKPVAKIKRKDFGHPWPRKETP